MENVNPEECVHFLKQAKEDAFNTLREKVKEDEWLEDFLNAGGLELIVQELYFSIHFLSQNKDTGHHGDSLPFRFVSCLRDVLNNLIGFDEFVRHPDYTKKLMRCLLSSDVKVKQSIIEILAVEAKIHEDGLQYVMDALNDFKIYNNDAYSLSFIVKELRNEEILEPNQEYQAILLGFINCIICNEDFVGRIKLRKELDDLGFYDLPDTFSESENKNVSVQWQVFLYQQIADIQANDTFDHVDSPTPPPPPPPPQAPPPPTASSSDRSPLEGTPWQPDAHAQELFDRMQKPSKEMVALTWEKIDMSKLVGGDHGSIWEEIICMKDAIPVDMVALEKHFGKKEKKKDKDKDKDKGKDKDKDKDKDKKKEIEKIDMDHMRRLHINAVLKTNSEIKQMVQILKTGMVEGISIDILEQFSKIMPTQKEMEAINSLSDKKEHPEAEQFFLLFKDFDNYEDFVQTTLLIKKLPLASQEIKRNIGAAVLVCEQIMSSSSLKAFLRYVLHTGNFINHSSQSNGKAVGFQLGSLQKLSELKSPHEGRRTLLHHLVEEIESKKPSLFEFVNDLHQSLADSVRFDNIVKDLKEFTEMATILQDVKGTRVKENFSTFFQNLQKDMDEMDEEKKIFADITSKMQQYFCVREDLFKLQDFLQTLKKFCDQIEQVRKAILKATNTKSKSPGTSGHPTSAETERPVDDTASSIRRGNCKKNPLRVR